MDERQSLTHAKDLLDSFSEMKSDRRYCDFILKIGDEEIPVHRNVLAGCSKYFDRMFQNEMMETESGFVEILGIEPQAGRQCVLYIYTGKAKLSRDNLQNLIHAAEMMQLHGLVDLCFEYLVENISEDNCLEYMELAVTYNKPSFAKIFNKFLRENFGRIMKTDDFLAMDHTVLSQCMESLPSEAWNSEKLKWEALLIWINGNIQNRRGHFPDLFQRIKLENLPVDFLREKISNNALVLQSDQCKLRIFDAFRSGDNPNPTVKSHPGILSFNKRTRFVHKYDPVTEKWTRFTGMMPSGRNIVELNGNFYCGCGDSLMMFSIHEKVWKSVFNIGSSFQGLFPLAVYDSYVVAVTQSQVCRYNTNEEKGENFQPGSTSYVDQPYAIAASNDFVYAIPLSGGNTAREFSFERKTWEAISLPNYARNEGAAAFYRGKLIVLGGYHYWPNNDSNRRKNITIEYYQPAADQWIALPRCEENFYSGLNPKPFVIGDELYIVQDDRKVKKMELRGL